MPQGGLDSVARVRLLSFLVAMRDSRTRRTLKVFEWFRPPERKTIRPLSFVLLECCVCRSFRSVGLGVSRSAPCLLYTRQGQVQRGKRGWRPDRWLPPLWLLLRVETKTVQRSLVKSSFHGPVQLSSAASVSPSSISTGLHRALSRVVVY